MPETAEAAFLAYEAVRARLPGALTPREWIAAGSLADVSDRFDVFLLDAFGVLNIGETTIPEAVARVAALRAAGKRVMVLTNAASHTAAAQAAKYARLGFDFAAGDVISSRDALRAAMPSVGEGRRWGVMAAPGDGFEDFVGYHLWPLGDDPTVYETVDGFLMLSTADWSEARQGMLTRSLAARPRPVLVGNPDIVAPRETGFTLEPGHYAHRLIDRTGISARFFGKPFRNIFDLAFARLPDGFDRARVVMVGDSLHTDILGGRAAGVATALVTGFGFFAGHDVAPFIRQSGITPDFILDRT
ncbi:TIGR01459 family HAD-type hydrolase [Aliigemmobacter aestuarii]|uniref:TIGR01459 family HAD-type hydrolase n=1 Tax=Aliigemmobacter aestuarii TaxID=1445661 RepID=A0A4S3MN12_9RHOB|nr:HAD hydrolase-like protein [Gemmobacter aestuarii]THD82913.1 TIGR01459 family HAD-type hydrolase [Gemmobacter aestuarii]